MVVLALSEGLVLPFPVTEDRAAIISCSSMHQKSLPAGGLDYTKGDPLMG